MTIIATRSTGSGNQFCKNGSIRSMQEASILCKISFKSFFVINYTNQIFHWFLRAVQLN
jgi:hypothetical protein